MEWLSLDSALFYNLEGLGFLPNLTLLRLNYKSRPIDQTVVDFFSTSCHNLSVLHLFDVKDIHMDDLRLTVGQCKVSWDVELIVNIPSHIILQVLDTLVLNDCSIRDDWDHIRTFDRRKPLSETVRHLQLIMLQIIPSQMVTFLNLFKGLQVLEMDVCDLDLDSMKAVLLNQPLLHTFRCATWLHTSALNLANLQLSFRFGRDECAFSQCNVQYLFQELQSPVKQTESGV